MSRIALILLACSLACGGGADSHECLNQTPAAVNLCDLPPSCATLLCPKVDDILCNGSVLFRCQAVVASECGAGLMWLKVQTCGTTTGPVCRDTPDPSTQCIGCCPGIPL